MYFVINLRKKIVYRVRIFLTTGSTDFWGHIQVRVLQFYILSVRFRYIIDITGYHDTVTIETHLQNIFSMDTECTLDQETHSLVTH